jgi:hypothetical protein
LVPRADALEDPLCVPAERAAYERAPARVDPVSRERALSSPSDVRDIESAGRFERGEVVRLLSGQHPRARVVLAPLDQLPQGGLRRSCSARASVSRGSQALGNGVAHRETVLSSSLGAARTDAIGPGA